MNFWHLAIVDLNIHGDMKECLEGVSAWHWGLSGGIREERRLWMSRS